MGEGLFRVVGFDFNNTLRAWRQYPIYYRYPTVPTGEVFFRRPGSERWTGQVLNTMLKQLGIVPNPYSREPVVTLEYDRRGFRNPDHLSDWKIAVAGDSFTELGYLPYEALFTSILAETLKVPVLNLGTSFTGPLTYLSYLRDYGIAPSTTHTMIVFFEGNDPIDLMTEYRSLARWQKTGQRGFREFKKQPSLIRFIAGAVGGRLYHPSRRLTGPNPFITAYFASSQGDIPVTLTYSPPGRRGLSAETRHCLDDYFRGCMKRYPLIENQPTVILYGV